MRLLRELGSGRRVAGLLAALLGLLACTPMSPTLAVAPPPAPEPAHQVIPASADDDDREQAVEPPLDGEPRCSKDAAPALIRLAHRGAAADTSVLMTELRGGEWAALPLQRASFSTVVIGSVAETEVRQVFANPFAEPRELSYEFPLSAGARVDDFELSVGSRSLHSEIQLREQDPAPETSEVERRDQIFTRRLASIPPGHAIEISLHLVELLEQDQGATSLVLPTARPPSSQTPADGLVACPELDIEVAIEPGLRPRALRSRAHAIDIRRARDLAFVELDPGATMPANRDFVLSWELGRDQAAAAIVALPDARDEGRGAFTLTLQPPAMVDEGQALPRELIFVIDTSYSMAGQPLATAAAVIRRSLESLRPDDRFAFTGVHHPGGLVAPTEVEVAAALASLDAVHPGYTTTLFGDLAAAAALPHDPERLRLIVVVSDGFVSDDDVLLRSFPGLLGDARWFSVGVGDDPNRFLLDGLARVGLGAADYAADYASADALAQRVHARLATPVLRDVEIDWGGLAVSELTPSPRIPDLFADQPVVVLGRYLVEGEGEGEIVIRARARDQLVELPVHVERTQVGGRAGVSSLWAEQRIDALLGYPALRGPHDLGYAAARQAAIEFARAHRVTTEFSALVAREDPSGAAGESLYAIAPASSPTTQVRWPDRRQRVPRRRYRVRPEIADHHPRLSEPETIHAVIRAHLQEVRRCHTRALTRRRDVAGRVTINFVITKSGAVSSAIVQEDTTHDLELRACIVEVIRGLQFLPPQSAGALIVSYPFEFEIRHYGRRPYAR